MLVVITGLDGSGTSSIAEKLHEMDSGSFLLKTPSEVYSDRKIIDHDVREISKVAHMLYYLSADVYISDYIRKNCDYQNHNVYLVRYLIDTVVSNRVAKIPLELNYHIFGNQLLIPDLTLFVGLEENQRQFRITNRGKSELDFVLDNDQKRNLFLNEFHQLLDPEATIYIKNDDLLENVAVDTYQKIKCFQNRK